MIQDEQITALKRDIKRLKIALGTVGLVGAAGFLIAAAQPTKDAKFGTVTAERINIVEPDGLYRMVMTNGARTPGPMLEARDGAKEGTRNFPFAGIILYDQNGQEQGGLGTGAKDGVGQMAANILDWPGGKDGGFGEAVGSFRRIDADGKGSAGIFIVDRPPAGKNPGNDTDRRRIKLQNIDRDAEVLLADAQGRDRIKMRVDKAGEASIEIVDQQGKTVFRAPAK